MFENLSHHHAILVTGPQRSGTRITGKMIAHDTGLRFVDEEDIEFRRLDILNPLFEKGGVVVQAPALSSICHEFPDNVCVVFSIRDVDDIIASQARIGWPDRYEVKELSHYGVTSREQPVSLVKYLHWAKQKLSIKHWVDSHYADLKDHPLWVEERGDFIWNQTE